jgi:hypothetical protein
MRTGSPGQLKEKEKPEDKVQLSSVPHDCSSQESPSLPCHFSYVIVCVLGCGLWPMYADADSGGQLLSTSAPSTFLARAAAQTSVSRNRFVAQYGPTKMLFSTVAHVRPNSFRTKRTSICTCCASPRSSTRFSHSFLGLTFHATASFGRARIRSTVHLITAFVLWHFVCVCVLSVITVAGRRTGAQRSP